ncbi:hypothetical protein K458DRAFT_389093 [Lentithecium fluviatile CBS 122367]|uniref:Uncharacterized protein n=1 Tax=Lentithecium fluviatile CBS 122367 TaxID=1168545 RepID=A0A6G1J292_9PLEO|nr:hypothetical protein K458DRAFT_389093 [Lentithecium fluviatile CBS 122367]
MTIGTPSNTPDLTSTTNEPINSRHMERICTIVRPKETPAPDPDAQQDTKINISGPLPKQLSTPPSPLSTAEPPYPPPPPPKSISNPYAYNFQDDNDRERTGLSGAEEQTWTGAAVVHPLDLSDNFTASSVRSLHDSSAQSLHVDNPWQFWPTLNLRAVSSSSPRLGRTTRSACIR